MGNQYYIYKSIFTRHQNFPFLEEMPRPNLLYLILQIQSSGIVALLSIFGSSIFSKGSENLLLRLDLEFELWGFLLEGSTFFPDRSFL